MRQIEIAEKLLFLLKRGSLPFIELYEGYFKSSGIKKSDLVTCIKDLKQENFIDYEGSFNDDLDVVVTRFGEQMLSIHGTYSRYLNSKSDITRYDRIVKWGKNNLLIALIMLIIPIASALIAFRKEIKELFTSNHVTTSEVKSDSVKHSPVHIDTPKVAVKENPARVNVKPQPEKKEVADSKVKEIKPDDFCSQVKTIFNGLNTNYKNEKVERISWYEWTTNIKPKGAISCFISELTRDSAIFKATFYNGYDNAKAGAIYETLIDQMSCIGKPSQEYRDSHLEILYREVLYQGHYAIIYLMGVKEENGVRRKVVGLNIQFISWSEQP